MGSILEFEGPLICEGTWTGLDGKPTHYSFDLLTKRAESWLGTPVKYGHRDNSEDVVGFHTGIRIGDRCIYNRGYIFDKDVIKEYEAGTIPKGQSLEADVVSSWDETNKRFEATDLKGTATAIGIKHPACPDAKIENTTQIKLEEKKRTMELDELLAKKPTADEFWGWLEGKVKDANGDAGKIMSLLKGAIKIPYPYPAPTQDELPAELSAYTDFIKKCMKDGKSMTDCAKEWTPVKESIDKLSTDLTTATAKLESFVNAELTKISADIKAIDKDFDDVKYLEGVSCSDAKKKMLESYLANIRRFTTVKLGLSDQDKIKKIDDASKSVFGVPFKEAVDRIVGKKE